jgi:hypothetical protein
MLCAEKRRYQTRREAKDFAKRSLKISGCPTRPYLCKHCQGWHLTRPRPRHNRAA